MPSIKFLRETNSALCDIWNVEDGISEASSFKSGDSLASAKKLMAEAAKPVIKEFDSNFNKFLKEQMKYLSGKYDREVQLVRDSKPSLEFGNQDSPIAAKAGFSTMLMINPKFDDDNLSEGEVVSLKPALKAKKQKEKEESLKVDYSKTSFGFERAGYNDEVAFVAYLNVPKDALKNMGTVVRDTHDYIGKRFGKWFGTPTVGGLKDRAKNGIVKLSFKFDVDPMFAYGLGYNLSDRRTSEIAKNKGEVERRVEEGEKMKEELLNFKSKAKADMDKLNVPQDERDRMWKENYMEKYKKLAKEYEDKGFSVIPFMRKY